MFDLENGLEIEMKALWALCQYVILLTFHKRGMGVVGTGYAQRLRQALSLSIRNHTYMGRNKKP
jgi:hypothetical protein